MICVTLETLLFRGLGKTYMKFAASIEGSEFIWLNVQVT